MEDNSTFVTFIQNPETDILFGYMGKGIPSKRVDFKPVPMKAVHPDGKEEILNNFYEKKPSSQSVLEFEKLIRDEILDSDYRNKKILKPNLVEVVISISLTEKKYFDIDVDNIAKTILDSITGYLIEDDSQVKRVVCEKDIHPLNVEGFFVAVTKLNEKRKGLAGNMWLFTQKND